MYHGIQTEVLTLNGHNNDEIEGYLARPTGDGPFPGVVIIHHAPGWDEWTLEVTWKLANRGFAVISPHLYSRYGKGDPDEVDRTETELRAQGKTFEFYRYESAGHAFLSTDRYRYRPEQAVDAWNKIYAFFSRYLKIPTRGMVPNFVGPAPTVSLAGNIP